VRSGAPHHALADQGALVLGDGAADLQQELVVRVSAHRPVEELDLGTVPLQFLDEQHLMDVVWICPGSVDGLGACGIRRQWGGLDGTPARR
jgi:hypothetical protein